jgi:VIT1/CCC1 family predicted Fe2+/Mn2+ transporter
MSKKVEIDKDIILDISPSYYSLPRKAKKAEMKRIIKEITEALNHYITNYHDTKNIYHINGSVHSSIKTL